MLKPELMPSVDEPEPQRPERKRRSGMPDQSAYADTGCELASSCLECPLPRCKYDDPRWRQRHDLKTRDSRIVELRQAGYTVKEVAAEIGVSDRTAYRVLLRDKRGQSNRRKAKFEPQSEPEDQSPAMTLEELAQWRPVARHTAPDLPELKVAS